MVWRVGMATPGVVDRESPAVRMVKGQELARLHRELLPLAEVDFGAEGFGARIYPYQSATRPGEPLSLQVEVTNPFGFSEQVTVELVLPAGWKCSPPVAYAELPGNATTTLPFEVLPPAFGEWRRARVAADLTVGDRRFGQQAEALVDVR
ncbi:MAG TPA: hypothetical protein VFM54_18155 [Micromonosporaceae bacterium]|nr:hypothetical protein [Micromonosporaceae bacterium]